MKNNKNNTITISDFLSTEYKDFSIYTIEHRALPSLVDGFKVVNRKIMNTCMNNWKTGNEKTLKVFQLSGKTSDSNYYHHGSSSLDNAIINMAQKFKNNLPLLEEDGIFGTLRSPYAGAPRYIGTKLSPIFYEIFKDFGLMEYRVEEGVQIEPKFFLPIIPMLLINGQSGIAVGFSTNILNRNPIDLCKYCLSLLEGKKSRIKLPPYNKFFKGDFIQDPENNKRWFIRGSFERMGRKDMIKITELPISYTYEKYENILDELVEKGKISSYDDLCKGNINYIIKLNKGDGDKLDDQSIIKLLKLEETTTEIFNVIDENNKLKQFENIEDIIKHFIDFRLGYYQKRKDYQISEYKRQIQLLKNKTKFILNVIKGNIELRNKPKETIIKQIDKIEVDKIDGSYNYLLSIPLYSITKEYVDKFKKDISDKENEIKILQKSKIEEIYIEDLKKLIVYLNKNY